jgi:predicted RNase H-like HicB family nuclease
MARNLYTALFYREDAGYSVLFPDVPGCATQGDTLAEALRKAEDALTGHLEALADFGDPVPEPREPDQVPDDSELGPAAFRFLVPVDRPGRATRVNITVEEGLLARVDNAAAARRMSRSAFLAEGARRLLQGG